VAQGDRIVASCTTEATLQVPCARRVLSVGDLHGDYESTRLILRELGVMGKDGAWIGGDTILVQTGDVTDRGDASGPIYKQLFRLQDEAPKAGGQVILLLGNHELMNLQGDFRYATPMDTASLGASEVVGGRIDVFSPMGWVGSGLRERAQAVALLGRKEGLSQPILYVHAGVTPELAEALVQEGAASQVAERLNTVLRSLLSGTQAQIRDQSSPLLGDTGPLWTRRLALEGDGQSPTSRICKDIQRSLDAFGAARMVVGHTAQADGKVHQRCGGRLILGDTLISKAYTGTAHPSAVEVVPDGTMTAVYPATGERFVLPTPTDA